MKFGASGPWPTLQTKRTDRLRGDVLFCRKSRGTQGHPSVAALRTMDRLGRVIVDARRCAEGCARREL